MFGGILKSISLAAVVVSAGTLSAHAADLGGNCCADLEDRIAELEATTARKGNRKVSLTVSGQINEAVMFWDDGVEKNAYVVTNESSRSRFRFVGAAKIDAAWTAGYLLEIGIRANRQNNLSQTVDSAKVNGGLDVRHSAWWLQNKDLGKVWIGQTSQAADGITEINLAATGHFAGPQIWDSIGGFALRGKNGALSGQTVTNLGLDNTPGEGARFNVVKYETPTLAGFIGSASWGEDDVWDVALRYAGEAGGFKLAAGIAYTQWTDGNENPRICTRIVGNGKSVRCDELGLSASLMHVPTGLFVTGLYGYRNDDQRAQLAGLKGTANGTKSRDEVYSIQAGIERAFWPVGKSTVFGEYWEGNFGAPITTAGPGATSAPKPLGLTSFGGVIGTTDISMWGAGFNQNIAAAAMDVYVGYRNYSFDVKDVNNGKAGINDIQVLMTGARIQF